MKIRHRGIRFAQNANFVISRCCFGRFLFKQVNCEYVWCSYEGVVLFLAWLAPTRPTSYFLQVDTGTM